MYPETDVPSVEITKEKIERIKTILPELPETKAERLAKQYRIHRKLIDQIIASDYADLFEEIASTVKVPASVVTVTLTETLTSLRREGVDIGTIEDRHFRELFKLIDKGKTVKEAIPDILAWVSKHPEKSVEKAIETLGLRVLSPEEIGQIVSKKIEENIALVKELGMRSFKKLMGIIMEEVRGRAEVKMVSEMLKRKIEETIA
jgi:glutamyl-tRNA(Gln) amidotransferase subunit E